MALKRQQAAEDAIALGLRAVATGSTVQGYLPPGPIFGIPVTEPLDRDQASDEEIEIKDTSDTSQHSKSSHACMKSDDSNHEPGNERAMRVFR